MLGRVSHIMIPGLKNSCVTRMLTGLGQVFSEVDERRRCDSWWWSSEILGEETKECVALSLGIQSELMVDGSWVQVQRHSCDRQSERH